MRLSPQTAAWLAAGLALPAVIAQTSSPNGPVHPGQPANCIGWHTVVEGDTCQTVPQRYGISWTQFFMYNPAVTTDCLTNFWLGSAYCVRVGTVSSSKPVTSSSSSSSKATISSTAISTSKPGSQTSSTSAPTTSSSYNSTYSILHPTTSWNISATSIDTAYPPTKTLAGERADCNAWHLVRPGDTCQGMVDRYGIRSIEEFLSWNPAAKDDCEMLIADYWVCVGVQRQQYNTNLVWETTRPVFTGVPEPTVYTSIEPEVDFNFTPSPSHGPMPRSCKVFHRATANQNCNDLVNIYGQFTQQEFFSWNPALNGNCQGLWLDTYYCVGAYSEGVLPLPAHQLTKPTTGKIPMGFPKDCTRWMKNGVGGTCDLIALAFGSFSAEDFIKWNPSVFDDCAGIQKDAWYCVGRPDTPMTRTPGAPTTIPMESTETESSTMASPSSTRPVTTTRVSSSARTSSATSVAPTPTSKPVSNDSMCGGVGGQTCLGSEFGDCCSASGWCGSSTAHCNVGCQSAFGNCTVSTVPISDDGTCGGAGGKTCLGSVYGDCCSSGGWCGDSTAHCAVGCQSAFGTCTTVSDKTSPDGSCGGANGYTCLNSGFGDCCSEYGWCGSSSDHCTVGLGRQAGFGVCT